jgi:hypothetical protein
MDLQSERQLWRVLGIVSGLVAAALLARGYYLFWFLGEMTRWPLRIGLAGAFALLGAICFLMTSRILSAIEGTPEGFRGTAWKLFSFVSFPMGVITLSVEMMRLVSERHHPLTSNNKAVFAAGSFMIMAGIAAFAGQRCVHHLLAHRTPEERAVSA